MSLAPGSRVGIYQVVELLDVGGMGEVYRAIDSRLDRAVAIKTLPAEFAAAPERLARFEREAKTLAQLNHPHIASIYGIEPGTPVALGQALHHPSPDGDGAPDRRQRPRHRELAGTSERRQHSSAVTSFPYLF